ncbi:MAG: hypothetical protein IPN76_31315 [Saprospiraceae bacterium]|nr:hypothetical protein [Saprospiraceae bacterium]
MKTIAVFWAMDEPDWKSSARRLGQDTKVKALIGNTASFNIQHERLPRSFRGTPWKRKMWEMTIKGADTVFCCLKYRPAPPTPLGKGEITPDLLKVS